ncbi:MAG: helix-turn-helix domain-containing protein [Proteobacteria bacterium]|nr:helix-turn-helix domain-containing protein [Pseudomonadota bacterium]
MAEKTRRGRPRGQHTNGTFLRRKRESLNLTRGQLAERAGLCSSRTIMRAERGDRISADSLERLAGVLGVAVHEMIRSPRQEIAERLTRFGLAAPPPPMPWLRRSKQAERVIACVTAAVPCCITGPSGIGKTALARFVARQVASRFSQGVVWVLASRNRRPIDPQMTQLQIAEALEFRARLPMPEQVDRDAFDAAFAAEFWAQSRLLIVDDILSPSFVGHFVPAGQSAPIITTSHLRHVAGDYGDDAIVLDRISIDDTRHILAHYLDPVRLDAQGVVDIHRELGGIPRSIHIAAKILQRERLVHLAGYAARIHADVLAGDYPEAMRTPETSLQVSFSSAKLHVSPGAWSLLGALSLFDEVPFLIGWASAVAAVASRAQTERYLSELIDIYLLSEVGDEGATGGRGSAMARRFRLESHVPIFARSILGDRQVTALEELARHAAGLARAASAETSWDDIRAELALWTHVLDTLVSAVFDSDELASWEVSTAFPRQLLDRGVVSSVADIMGFLAPFLEREPVPGGDRWLRAGAACAAAVQRNADHGRLLLALGRFWSRAHVDLQKPIPWLDDATERLAGENDFAHASAAASEAGRALFGCERPAEGLQRFDRAIVLARQALEHGTELACRINSAAVSFTRHPGVEGWKRAAALLADAVAACTEDDFDGRFVRIVCMCNQLVTRMNLHERGISLSGSAAMGSFAEAIAEWRQLDIAAPLFEARLLLLKALQDPGEQAGRTVGLHAQARSLWRDRLDEGEPIDPDLMWLLTEIAFYVRLQLECDTEPENARSPVIAGGLGLTDVTREIYVDNGNLVPVGLLFPVPPLMSLFDDAYTARVARASREILGAGNRLLDELSRIRELQARSRASAE